MTSSGGSANGRPIGVLICDDVDEMRALLRIVVGSREGMRIVGEACGGNEAVLRAERLQPDVVLLDLSMPGGTGLDALGEIGRVAPAAQVIVLSGFAASTIAADVVARGAWQFIEKGAHPDVILAAIEAAAAAPARVPAPV